MEQAQEPRQETSTSSSWLKRNLAIIMPALAVGILIGVLGLMIYQEHLPWLTSTFYYITLVVFAAVVLLFLAFVAFKKYILKSLLGSKVANADTLLDDAQVLTEAFAVQAVDKLIPDASAEQKERIKNAIPKLSNWFVWGRLRNWWWQWLLSIFVAIGGLTGTLLLMTQNKLIKEQTLLLERQNTLVESQTRLAENQMYLSEASRRSALVFLMSNIMDKVDAEIAAQKLKRPQDSLFTLSPSLIGQIAALSHSLKPYRYLDGDTLITKPLSPERGQLLITLTQLPLDSATFAKIYEKATFSQAALQDAVLINANLRGVELVDANLERADLGGANLSKAYLNNANLSRADIMEANLTSADLSEANLSETILYGANLSRADLNIAYLSGADLNNADFASIKNLSLAQLKTVSTLYNCKNLPDSLKTALLKTHPQLFEKPEWME